jgi:hypothetical protein
MLGVDDYEALRRALSLGFGWRSTQSFLTLCCSLWAKSRSQCEILTSLFNQLELQSWDLDQEIAARNKQFETLPITEQFDQSVMRNATSTDSQSVPDTLQVPVVRTSSELPLIDLTGMDLPSRSFVFARKFPLTPGDIANEWRYVGRIKTSGVPEEIDVDATIALRCRQGVPGAIVQRPRTKKKASRVMLFIDQQGSMAPFDQFVQMVWDTLKRSCYANDVKTYFFHDAPVIAADEKLLTEISDQPFPVLDNILERIGSQANGYLYQDKELLLPLPISEILEELSSGGNVIFISDAGAARHQYNLQRLLDTIFFVKAVHNRNQRVIWLNPLPSTVWQGSTAEQIARHVPMFTLDRSGLRGALAILKGHRYPLERGL